VGQGKDRHKGPLGVPWKNGVVFGFGQGVSSPGKIF
jgi:hypothetical protein